MEQVYKLVESLLIGGYTTYYQMMDENLPNTVGIFLYPGSPDVMDMSGDTVYEAVSVHLQLHAEQGETALFQGLANLRATVDKLESAEGNNEITIVSCLHKGPKSLMIGVNEHDLPVIVSNLELLYVLN